MKEVSADQKMEKQSILYIEKLIINNKGVISSPNWFMDIFK